EELSQVSSDKSQFLANMSHELRTPLNSMLLLSHLLAENESGNLSAKQVEHMRTIHAAGKDLLALINQVLDLSKIEAGKQEVELESVPLEHFVSHARRTFEPLAADRGLSLVTELEPGLPSALVTDRQRIERVLINLLSNAIKFTERGSVTLRVARPSAGARLKPGLLAESAIAFSVIDTGVGIAPEAQERVFAPFEQVESHTDRRFAGTGLGLAIARESVNLLGGELVLTSEPGKGSTFTCTLPEQAAPLLEAAPAAPRAPARPIPDDRAALDPNETPLLLIEDDAVLAEQLVDIIRARRMKAVVASSGKEGLALARKHKPLGIVLDVKLPDLDGWTVMELLKQDPVTRSIPVHFVSGVDAPQRGLALGAVGYLVKPASHAELAGVVRALAPAKRGSQRILVVEDDVRQADSVLSLLRQEGFEVERVASAEAALDALSAGSFGCIILDLGLPDMDGLSLLEELRKRTELGSPRVVIHTGRALTKLETRQLEAYSEAVVLKDGSSAQRLLEEVRLFVRYVRESLPKPQPSLPVNTGPEVALDGVTLVLAEDDMRTVYALSALLRGKGANVVVAETGREALSALEQHPATRAVLMDVMMPEMDGYEAMRRLRQDARFAALPVIALTAKAMKGERERCIEAGASDYLSKPIDSDKLLETLDHWLRKAGTDAAS
ncbi:MAG TPA: response regulator, partial [Polyangiaceae bacterium]